MCNGFEPVFMALLVAGGRRNSGKGRKESGKLVAVNLEKERPLTNRKFRGYLPLSWKFPQGRELPVWVEDSGHW